MDFRSSVVAEMTTDRTCTDESGCDYRFHEERAPVWVIHDGAFGHAYLGPDGAFAIGPVTCSAKVLSGPFHDGRAFLCDGDGYWLIDTSGTRLGGPWAAWERDAMRWDPEVYPGGLFFSEGYAAVPVEGGWSYVDTSGKVVLAGPYDAAFPFRLGMGKVIVGDDVRYLRADGSEAMIVP